MRQLKLTGLTILVCAFAHVSSTRAGELSQQQIQLIQSTANSICTTVRDAKGQRTDTQIEGDIRAQLGGIASRFVDVGGSGKASITKQEFQGLTQDATATAMVGDRDCREHVFDKMFDKLSSSGAATLVQVASDPDTVGIPPGGFHLVTYHFNNSSSLNVIIETQDIQWKRQDGSEIAPPCIQCRILGGSFSVPPQGRHDLLDNDYMPPELANQMRSEGVTRVTLQTQFHGRDENGNSVAATAVLAIVPLQ